MKSNTKLLPTSYFLLPDRGFTLIELMVVITIMGLITAMFLANFNSLRGPRNLTIAQNQVVTDIRKVQSYTLSSRDVVTNGASVPAAYYIMKFDTGSPANASYLVQAINKNGLFNSSVQILNLPSTVKVASLKVTTPGGTVYTPACIQVAFSLPYGRILMDDPTILSAQCNLPNTFNTSNDFTGNKNLILDVYLSDPNLPASTQKIVEINGISQAILTK